MFLNKGNDPKDQSITQEESEISVVCEDLTLSWAISGKLGYDKIFQSDLALYMNMQASRSTSDVLEEEKSFEHSPPND